jgi:GDP-D-mannose 3',5'-epimerase
MSESILVTGAGGFIGRYLVARFLKEGHRVRAVDKKPQGQSYQRFATAENLTMNLQEKGACFRAVDGCDWIFNMAANMGGMGFIELNKGLCMLTVLINTHMLMAARQRGASRFFFPSSACVYAGCEQQQTASPALKEEDATRPTQRTAMDGKNSSVRECVGISGKTLVSKPASHGITMSMVHTALLLAGARKRQQRSAAKSSPRNSPGRREIEVWGDGEQTRSFMFIDDCLHGTRLLMESDIFQPVNIGSSEMVTINQLVDVAEGLAGIELKPITNSTLPRASAAVAATIPLSKVSLDGSPRPH